MANIEGKYLGLTNELNVGATNLTEMTLGLYVDNTHEIVINMDSVIKDLSWDLFKTVCHESYHSYQHRMIDVVLNADEKSKNLRLFQKANSYMTEFDSYIDGRTDFCGYYQHQL